MKKHKIIHDYMTYKGSSGSPLILAKNHKVIGLHKGKDKKKNNKIVEVGISLKTIIEITKNNNINIVEEKEFKEYFFSIMKDIIFLIKFLFF